MPFVRARYPKDWPTISKRIREQAGQRCEWCGVENHEFYEDVGGKRVKVEDDEAEVIAIEGGRVVRVVLTVAHLDHDPQNCADENLKALCQRCHLRYDAKLHAANAAETRRKRKAAAGQGSLWVL